MSDCCIKLVLFPECATCVYLHVIVSFSYIRSIHNVCTNVCKCICHHVFKKKNNHCLDSILHCNVFLSGYTGTVLSYLGTPNKLCSPGTHYLFLGQFAFTDKLPIKLLLLMARRLITISPGSKR